MLILAIESSCDETAAAVVKDGAVVLSNIISSQIGLHRKTGGVVPEIAAREHVKNIMLVIDEALKVASVDLNDIDHIAVTFNPGLVGCLLVGRHTAQILSFIYDKPLINVNHIHGHVYANWLINRTQSSERRTQNSELRAQLDEFEFPIMVLSVSGGHNDLILVKNYGQLEIIGHTLDDAAGEAFDKIARMIGLDYPGGPSIQKAALNGNKKAFVFPRPMIDSNDFNFSFAGLKTSVLYKIRAQSSPAMLRDRTQNLDLRTQNECTFQSDISASAQEAICDVLVTKLLKAAVKYNVKEVHLTGGVSANLRLREVLVERAASKYKVRYPQNITFCTDNAAMIGAAAYFDFVAVD